MVLIKEIYNQINGGGWSVAVNQIAGTLGFKLTLTKAGAWTLTWGANTWLRDLLGYTADFNGSGDYAATYPPSYCWFPTHAPYDRERWQRDIGSEFGGDEMMDGNLVGLSTGPYIYRRNISVAFETALNTYEDAATNAYYAARCWQRFINTARTNAPTVSTAPSTKGFYFFPDISNAASLWSNTMDSGDCTKFEYSSSPETYCFCQLSPDGAKDPKPKLPTTRLYYDLDFEIHTATAPTWVTVS
jgi:hypothetical protein